MRNSFILLFVFCTLTSLSQERISLNFTEFFNSDNCPEFVLNKTALPLKGDSNIESFLINDLNINYFISSAFWNYDSDFHKIKVDIDSDQKVILNIDSDNDGKWNEEPIIGELNYAIKIDLLYSYGDNNTFKIPCDLVVSKSVDEINISAFLIAKCVSEYKSPSKSQSISFFKYGSGLSFIQIDGENIAFGSPLKLGDNLYKIFDFDYTTNILTLEKLNSDKKLYGVLEGFYVNEDALNSSLQFHKIDIDKQKYKVFYFWGHWCEPCTSSMKNTQTFLNGLSEEKFDVINVNLTRLTSDKNIVDSIIEEHRIKNNAYEYPTIGSTVHDKMPFINLFKNMSYPNFIVLDNNNKIAYSGLNNDITIQEFIDDLE